MSVEEKDKVVQKTQEEERELRKKVIDEKDEEKRSESSADEASSSDSETGLSPEAMSSHPACYLALFCLPTSC